jgi:hypothetical protein
MFLFPHFLARWERRFVSRPVSRQDRAVLEDSPAAPVVLPVTSLVVPAAPVDSLDRLVVSVVQVVSVDLTRNNN